jgi:transposase
MLSLTSTLQYRLYLPPCDMRKGFDGLCGLVTAHMGEDVMAGTVFIFINRSGNRVKLLRWEPGGMVIYYKRLEKGTFKRPKPEANSEKVSLGYAQLAMLIEGVSIEQTRQQKRYLLK